MVQSLETYLTSAQIASIIRRYKNGESGAKIGENYGVSGTAILNLLRQNGVKIKGRGRYKAS